MSLNIALHRPQRAEVQVFHSDGEMHGHVRFLDADGAKVDLYTTPAAAQAIKAAFDAAMAPAAAEQEAA